MLFDLKITAQQARKLGEWAVYLDRDAANVEIVCDDRMLVAEQGDERMAWDTDGSPAADKYLAADPLATPGGERLNYVYVVAPAGDYEPAVFAIEDDAQAYADTFDDDAIALVNKLLVCSGETAAQMIAERTDEDDEPYCAWCSDGRDEQPFCGGPGCKPNNDGRNWDTA